MKIAILGWGSLTWDSRELPYVDPWKSDGPELPLEFSRISKDCSLTLVIDPVHGSLCRSLYALSLRCVLSEAVEDLRIREGTHKERIGHYNHRTNGCSMDFFREQVDLKEMLSGWCSGHAIDGVVWTALPPNFDYEIKAEFSVERAVTFLKRLPKTAQKNALEYIHKAPVQINTPLRRRVAQEWPEV